MWGGDVGPQEQAPLYALTATEAAIQAVAELSSVKLPATTEAASESTDTWKTWLIWGLLGLAIAVLLGMAFQISKSMKKNNEIR